MHRSTRDEARSSPDFAPLLASFNAEEWGHRGSAVVYGLWPDMTLAYLSPSWFSFARENGGEPLISTRWGLGRSIFEAIPKALDRFYRELLTTALRAPAGPRPVVHEYECSSAAVYRRFAMHLLPLKEQAGLLVVNSLRMESPHHATGRTSWDADAARYADEFGTVHQCAHCRRIRVVGTEHEWHWVPAWVDRPPVATSHDVCGICLDYYYPPGG
jgi:hypothetical protein